MTLRSEIEAELRKAIHKRVREEKVIEPNQSELDHLVGYICGLRKALHLMERV